MDKVRCIQIRVNKYTLEGLLAKCDLKWPISETELLDGVKDAGLAQIVIDRNCQDEIVNFEFDNIFEVVTDNKEETKKFKPKTNESVANLRGAAMRIFKHIKAKQDILDEELLISVIQDALFETVAGGSKD
jgi:hypothetical protein